MTIYIAIIVSLSFVLVCADDYFAGVRSDSIKEEIDKIEKMILRLEQKIDAKLIR